MNSWRNPSEPPSNNPAPDPYSLALARLGVREYSVGEMRDYLEKKGADPAAIEEALTRLVAEGSLSDERYTLAVLRSQAARGKGPAYIRAKLQQKGVSIGSRELETLYQEAAPEDQIETIRKLVARRYPRAHENPRERQRAFRGLVSRGFSPSAISRVLREED